MHNTCEDMYDDVWIYAWQLNETIHCTYKDMLDNHMKIHMAHMEYA